MKTLFDDKSITFKCPKCGYEITQTIGWLKDHDRIECPGCGVGIKLDTRDLARGTEEAQKSLDRFPKSITIKL